MSLEPYEVYAVRYAHNPAARSSHNFLGGDPHDEPMPLDYFVWAIGQRARSSWTRGRERRKSASGFPAFAGRRLKTMASTRCHQDVIIAYALRIAATTTFPNAK